MNNIDLAKMIEPAFNLLNVMIIVSITISLLVFILLSFFRNETKFKYFIKPFIISVATSLFYAILRVSYTLFEYPMFPSSGITELSYLKGWWYSLCYMISYWSIFISLVIGMLLSFSLAFYPLIYRKRGYNHAIASFALSSCYIWIMLVNGLFLYLLTTNLDREVVLFISLILVFVVLQEIILIKYFTIKSLLKILNKLFPNGYDNGESEFLLLNSKSPSH